MDDLIARIEREAGLAGLTDILAHKLTASDARSLLLEVARRRARARTAAEVLRDYERDAFVRPATAPTAVLLGWEGALLSALPAEVEALALSRVCPLGSSSAVAPIDPNWAVATVRGSEVVSDLAAGGRRRGAAQERSEPVAGAPSACR